MVVDVEHTPGYHDHKQQLVARLKRIEGQVRGLQRMIDEDTYCIDVLTQVAATTKALQAVAVLLLEEHLRHCVAAATPGHDDEDDSPDGRSPQALLDEAVRAVERLLRT